MTDPIERQAAIDEANAWLLDCFGVQKQDRSCGLIRRLEDLPSAQPTLYGYNIEHLEQIAIVLQKENLPPERVVEALTDVGRIVAIVKDEIEEALKRDVERWVMNGIAGTVERRNG